MTSKRFNKMKKMAQYFEPINPGNLKSNQCNRMKYLLLIFFIFYNFSAASGQAKTRKLSSSINHPSINLYAPFMSADGNAMIFLSDNAEDQILTPFYTVRDASDWREPQMLPKLVHTRLNFARGYGLNADGKRLFISTVKSPGVGGYDLWYSDWKVNTWADPVNFGMPINTKAHEASASITPDGNAMYFMRCEKMDSEKADNCKLFRVLKKSNGQWDAPMELPANINTGNSQTPRIMADGETLIFSSNKIPGKGGMDLFVTKSLGSNQWSDPRPLDFVNTSQDDQYVSVAALGRYLLKDAQGQRKSELVEFLIPNELRPKGLMKVEGKVSDETGGAIAAYVSATDLTNGKRTYSGRPASDGAFVLYLKEGTTYELGIDPEKDNVTFFTKIFDLTTDKIPQIEKVTAMLRPVRKSDILDIGQIAFKPNSSELDIDRSANELKRIARILNGDPSLNLEIQVNFTGYREDSIQSSPDLTEVRYDSIAAQYDEIDSLGQLYKVDTMYVDTVFHNNRTEAQGQAIAEYLKSQGIDDSRLTFIGSVSPAALPEKQKLSTRVRFY
jgi:hypothetical protein